MDDESYDLTPVLTHLAEGRNLSSTSAEAAFDIVMTGAAHPAQIAALLMGLRAKGLVPAELAGAVRALRKAMVPVPAREPESLVDTAGTGGGAVTTFNISTAAALVAAAGGARVAKHGNRSFTSRSGSADVLEALGVRIELAPERMAAILDEVGLVFMFAPLLHPAMRHVAPVRRALGITTVMNVVGPLANPAGARRQVIGVSDPALLHLVADALAELGHLSALVVHGAPGMDELSPVGPTRIVELSAQGVVEREIVPEQVGLAAGEAAGLAGGDPAANAEIITRVLGGAERGVARTAVVLNAAAALYVAGIAETLEDGVSRALHALDDGAALDLLERLKRASRA